MPVKASLPPAGEIVKLTGAQEEVPVYMRTGHHGVATTADM